MQYRNILVSATVLTAAILTSSFAMAVEKGDFLARARIINISPNVSTDDEIDIDSAVTLDIDFTYMVTNNFGVELLLALPATHDITGTGSISSIGKIGEVAVLPPALIAQYYFMPSNNIRPYVGAGINYTLIGEEETTDALTQALGATSTNLAVDNSFGFVGQAGVDIDITKKWYLNFDVKYIILDTSAKLNVNGGLAAGTQSIDFDLDPLVIGAGIGTRF
jgi:outer membrane protein